MNLPAIFRVLVLGSLVTGWAGAAVDLIPGLVPESIVTAVDATIQPGQLHLVAIAAVVLLPALLVATVGLVLFKGWSRPLALVCTFGTIAVYPATPTVAESGWAAMFYYLSALSWGAALAIAYASPLASRSGRGS